MWALAYPPARSSLAIFRATTFASCPTRILDSIGLPPTSTHKRCGVFIRRISASGSASMAASPLKCFGYRPQASTVTFASAEENSASHELYVKKRGPHSDGPAHQILSGRRSSACGRTDRHLCTQCGPPLHYCEFCALRCQRRARVAGIALLADIDISNVGVWPPAGARPSTTNAPSSFLLAVRLFAAPPT